jgi:hypothetical protein
MFAVQDALQSFRALFALRETSCFGVFIISPSKVMKSVMFVRVLNFAFFGFIKNIFEKFCYFCLFVIRMKFHPVGPLGSDILKAATAVIFHIFIT